MSHPQLHITLSFLCHTLCLAFQLAHIFEAEASLTRLSDQATHKALSSPCSTSVRHPPFTSLAAHQREHGIGDILLWHQGLNNILYYHLQRTLTGATAAARMTPSSLSLGDVIVAVVVVKMCDVAGGR